MKSVILAILLVVAVRASLIGEKALFESFKATHGKTYSNQVEETTRFAIFQDNLVEIEAHNALYDQGLVTYQKSINQFSDMTEDEFKSYLTLYAKPTLTSEKVTPYLRSNFIIPESIDWRELGYVTDVKDQKSCGSCWAFALTGSIEGAYFRNSGNLVSFSEQQLIDCTTDINLGCSGGYLEETLPYVEENGIESEESYPYTGSQSTCSYNASKAVTNVSSYQSIADEATLLEVVATKGPVAVALDASYLASYASGIYTDTRCSADGLNHGALIVGYGTEDDQDYWIIKNSWGSLWGEQGYFKLLRGTNECGIAEYDVYPVV